ncbi:MAG: hypothetical protein ABIH42_11460 [Planctomycetota bacterium]
MNKEDALKYLNESVDTVEILKKKDLISEEFTTWLLTTKDLLRELFEEKSDFYSHFNSVIFEHSGDSRFDSWYYKLELDNLKKEAYLQGLTKIKGILRSAITHIERFGLPEKK